MSSDEGSRDRASRRSRPLEDNLDEDRPSKRHGRDDRDDRRRRRRSNSKDRTRDRERENGRREERDRSRSREHRRRERRRSRTPDSSRRNRSRSRGRDRESDHGRDRDRRDRDGDDRRRRRHHRDSARDSNGDRHKRPRSTDGKEVISRRRRHRSDDSPSPEDASRRSNRSPVRRNRGPLPSQADSFNAVTDPSAGDPAPDKPKEKPNFTNTGLLAAASNSVQQADGTAIALKYHEPPEARKPSARDDWKLFVFKGKDVLDTVPLGLRSCWLVGREAAVADLAAEHPSLSKQHAVLQFRYVEKRNEFGDRLGKVKPYLIDLESANGTVLNGKKIADSRYVELRDGDVVKFGHSSREYVIMLAPK